MTTYIFLKIAVCVGLGLILVFVSRRGDPKLSRTSMLLALALFAFAGSQGYAAYREGLTRAELASIVAAIEAMNAETTSGHSMSAEELKKHSDRKKALLDRLDAIPNK